MGPPPVGQIYPQGFVLTAASFKSPEKIKWECVEAYMLPAKTYDAPCRLGALGEGLLFLSGLVRYIVKHRQLD